MKGGRPTLDYAYRGGQPDNPNASVLERAVQRMAGMQRAGGSQVGQKGKTIKAAIGDVVCIENSSTAAADRPLVHLPKTTKDMAGKSVWVTFAANGTTAYYRVTASQGIDGATAGAVTDGDIVAPVVTHEYFCAGPEYGWRLHALGS